MKYKNLIKKSETVCQFLQHIHLICFSSDLNLKNSDINAWIYSLCELLDRDYNKFSDPQREISKSMSLNYLILLIFFYRGENAWHHSFGSVILTR